MNNFQKPNRIEELEKKLYSPNEQFDLKKRKKLNQKSYDVPEDWPDTQLKSEEIPETILDIEKKPNWFFRLFILAFIFFLGAASYVGIKMYLNWGVKAPNTEILINAPRTIGAGEMFAFEALIQNQNQVPIKFVTIDVQFPEGTRALEDISLPYQSSQDKIEILQIGEVIKKNYSALLFGEEGEKKEITVFITYQVDGSTVLFKKEKKFDVVLNSTPIRLTVTNVKETTSGQELEFTLELVSNSTQTLKNIIVQAVYPFGFSYKNSTILPQEDKKTWLIETLNPKETRTFKIQGAINGQNNDDKFFAFTVGLQDPNNVQSPQVVFTKKDTIVSIKRPFLEANLSINEKSGDVIILDPNSRAEGIISFTNNTNLPLRNAVISLLFKTNSIRDESISVSNGFYQSLTDIITWDNSTSQNLRLIPVGSSNSVEFNFITNIFNEEKIIINPEATFTINIKANRNPENKVSDIIENSITKKIKINSSIDINVWSEFKSDFFLNTGPVPPKAEQKTTYTSVIELKNTYNNVTNSVVKFRIPNYVQYEGLFKPESENVTYDPVTREITWNIGDVPAKTGYIGGSKKQLAFQVSIIPSVSQVNTIPILVSDIFFSGVDTFTQSELGKRAENIGTQIKDGKGYYEGSVSR